MQYQSVIEAINMNNIGLFEKSMKSYVDPLSVALKKGNFVIIDYLVNRQQKLINEALQFLQDNNFQGDLLEYKLIRAAENDDVERIIELMAEGANIHDDLLSTAVANNSRNVINFLLEQGVDIHENNDFVLTAAVISGDFSLFKFFLDLGLNPRLDENFDSAKNVNKNDTPFFVAVDGGDVDFVKYLMDLGARVDIDAVDYTKRPREPNYKRIHQMLSDGFLDTIKKDRLKAIDAKSQSVN